MKKRVFLKSAIAAAVLPRFGTALAAELGDNGLHIDPLFLETFFTLSDDLSDAMAEGKILQIVFEQRGCPYCRELHEVNMKRPEIRDALDTNFYSLQLDLWGAREVVDFDGAPMEERQFAEANAVNFTPTALFYDETGTEIFRMPGYFKPFHHLSALEYVSKGEYKNQPFQRFLQDKFQALEAEGIDPEVW